MQPFIITDKMLRVRKNNKPSRSPFSSPPCSIFLASTKALKINDNIIIANTAILALFSESLPKYTNIPKSPIKIKVITCANIVAFIILLILTVFAKEKTSRKYLILIFIREIYCLCFCFFVNCFNNLDCCSFHFDCCLLVRISYKTCFNINILIF